MHIQLVKADQSQRLIVGRIDETPDRAGEVFDYASSKPNFQKWSDEQSIASGGKSKGNLRAMHKTVAAGILTDIAFDDVAKAILFTAHVVDDDEWGKVEKGVYTGFSPGGKYAKRWKDGAHLRYTALPNEMSLVDRSCIPSASFSLIKADGSVEDRKFDDSVLAKAGARHSQADLDHIQAIHKHASALLNDGQGGGDQNGGACANKADATGDLAKVQGELSSAQSDLAKVSGELTETQATLAKISGENDTLKKRVEELEKLPAPGGPALHVVDKTADTLGKSDQGGGSQTTGTFEEELAKVNAMPAGMERANALTKLSEQFSTANT